MYNYWIPDSVYVNSALINKVRCLFSSLSYYGVKKPPIWSYFPTGQACFFMQHHPDRIKTDSIGQEDVALQSCMQQHLNRIVIHSIGQAVVLVHKKSNELKPHP